MINQTFDGGGIVSHLDEDETRANNGFGYKAYPPDGKDGFVRSYKTLREAKEYAGAKETKTPVVQAYPKGRWTV